MSRSSAQRSFARPLRSRRGARSGSFATVVAVVCGGVVYAAVASSAATPSPVRVTATADPASGGEVRAGEIITYQLNATADQPVPDGIEVVDDLSGLLDSATILSTSSELASNRLTLDQKANRLTWAVSGLSTPG